MNELAQALKPFILFAPEVGLSFILILHLLFDLFKKIEPKSFVRSCVLGMILLFVILWLVWPCAGVSLSSMFQLDPLAIFFKGIFVLSAIATLLMAQEFSQKLDNRFNDFCLILLTATLGSFFLVSSNDLITLFISIEWITISFYILTAYLKNDSFSLEAGVKYLIIGAFSSALFLYGISFVYGAFGSVFFADIKTALATGSNSLFTIGFFLILAGIGFKIAMFPFQLWVPDVYEGAPTPATAFLSITSKTAGFAALLKILFLMTGVESINWSSLLLLLSPVTLIYGNLAALRQTNMKRLFAYSSVAHVGYLLMGIATATKLGIEAVLYYLAVYALANSAAFLVIVISNRELKSGDISAYRGLAKKSPFLSGVFFVALLSLGGIPPLAGFFAKFLIFRAVILKGYLWLALIGAANVIISLYYYLSIVKEMYFKQPTSKDEIELSGGIKIFLLCLTVGIIFLGVIQEPFLNLIHISSSVLFLR